MSFFSENYETPGPGVPKGEPQKIGPIRYFVVARRKFWDLVMLNMIYFLFSLPALLVYTLMGFYFLGGMDEPYNQVFPVVFGFGMVTLLGSGAPRAGLCYVLRNYSREEHAFLWGDFWEYTKKYFLKGTLLFVLDVAFTFVICLDAAVYMAQGSFGGAVAGYAAIFLFLIYILMHPYLYMLLVTFDMKGKMLFKNAFLLTIIRVVQNMGCFLLAVAMVLVVFDLLLAWQGFLFMLLVMLYSFADLILDMNSFSVVKRYMIKDA